MACLWESERQIWESATGRGLGGERVTAGPAARDFTGQTWGGLTLVPRRV